MRASRRSSTTSRACWERARGRSRAPSICRSPRRWSPASAGAARLVFVDCLKELPATLLLRPLNVETLATYIYQFATRGSFEQGSLAALLIVAAGILPVIRITRYADVISGNGEAGRL